jgi:hypothetical protein
LIDSTASSCCFCKAHFWQNAHGKCIGTLEVHKRPDADEDAVIDASFNVMEPLVKENEVKW